MRNYKSILVAVDGSKEAEHALHKSINIAKFNGNSLLNIVNVIDTNLIAESDRTIMEREQLRSEEILQNYKAQAEAEGIQNVKVIIKNGFPKSVIAEEVAIAANADLIVCGATGLKNVEQFFLGSVSEAIMRTASCDVLVTRSDVPSN